MTSTTPIIMISSAYNIITSNFNNKCSHKKSNQSLLMNRNGHQILISRAFHNKLKDDILDIWPLQRGAGKRCPAPRQLRHQFQPHICLQTEVIATSAPKRLKAGLTTKTILFELRLIPTMIQWHKNLCCQKNPKVTYRFRLLTQLSIRVFMQRFKHQKGKIN